MLKQTFSSNIFSSRELNKLQTLYRSRAFNLQMNVSAESEKANSTSKKCRFTFYGSRGTLNANQWIKLREHINKTESYSNITIKLTLVTTPVTLSIMSASWLKKRESIFKGSTYQINIIVYKDTLKEQSNIDWESSIQQIMYNYINFRINLKYTEDIHFAFKPFLVLNPIKVKSPRRFRTFEQYVNLHEDKKRLIRLELLTTINTSYSKSLFR